MKLNYQHIIKAVVSVSYYFSVKAYYGGAQIFYDVTFRHITEIFLNTLAEHKYSYIPEFVFVTFSNCICGNFCTCVPIVADEGYISEPCLIFSEIIQYKHIYHPLQHDAVLSEKFSCCFNGIHAFLILDRCKFLFTYNLIRKTGILHMDHIKNKCFKLVCIW